MGMIDPYLVDPITIIKAGAVLPGWGEPAGTTEVKVMGKIEYRTRIIRSIAGEQVVAGTIGAITSSVTILLSASIETGTYLGRALSHRDKLKFNSIEHVILEIETPKAFDDPHYEVHVA